MTQGTCRQEHPPLSCRDPQTVASSVRGWAPRIEPTRPCTRPAPERPSSAATRRRHIETRGICASGTTCPEKQRNAPKSRTQQQRGSGQCARVVKGARTLCRRASVPRDTAQTQAQYLLDDAVTHGGYGQQAWPRTWTWHARRRQIRHCQGRPRRVWVPGKHGCAQTKTCCRMGEMEMARRGQGTRSRRLTRTAARP